MTRPLASVRHTVVCIAIFIGVGFLGRYQAAHASAAQSRSHVVQYLVLGALEWVFFLYVRAGLRRAGTSVADVIGRRATSVRSLLAMIALAGAFLLVADGALGLLKHAVWTSGSSALAEHRRTLALLAPRGILEMVLWGLLSVTAGIVEEFIFRGYLQRQLGALTRSPGLGIALAALVFGFGHLYQGVTSAILIAIYGAMFGLLAHFSRSLIPGMMAHATEDLVSGLIASMRGF